MNKKIPPKTFDLILSWLNGIIKEDEISTLSDYDWGQIDETAKKEAVSSLLFYKFKTQDSLRFLPQTIQDTWQQHFYNNLIRNETILQGLSEVLGRLKAQDLSVILLKGTSLLVSIYPNAGLRHMADVDILIKRKDLFRVKQIIEDSGFDLRRPQPPKLIDKFDAELEFSKKDTFYLEVFTGLCQYERFKGIIFSQVDDIWNQAKVLNFQGQPFRILSCQDQILQLSLHLSLVHLFSGLNLFYDIKKILQHYGDSLNWNQLLEKAKQQRLCHCLYYTLSLIQRFFCQDIPSWLIEELRPSFLKRKFLNLLINKNCILGLDGMHRIKRYILQCLLMDRVTDGLRVFLKGIFPSREWFLYRYGNKTSRRICVYRLLHPFKILFS